MAVLSAIAPWSCSEMLGLVFGSTGRSGAFLCEGCILHSVSELSGFLPLSKHMRVRLISDARLPICVKCCLSLYM